MYIVDKDKNRLSKIPKRTFKEFGFAERQNLQEWIANMPDVFGEELLIIQKEFAGFGETKERLDLLALDKNGRLVVIENKLDDSGKDVVWQAIKYASYCSQLDTNGVIEVYQKYLGGTGSAAEKIMEFLGKDDEEMLSLNQGNTQRIFMVAALFQKEVTSAALWLREFGIDVTCFEVKLSSDSSPSENGQIYFDIDQIIPPKSAEDFMIKLASKKQEEAHASESNNKRSLLLADLWQEYIEFDKNNKGLYSNSSGSYNNFLARSLKNVPGGAVCIVANRGYSKIEVTFDVGGPDRDSNKDTNKKMFDFFFNRKDEISKKIADLNWRRMDDNITSRIELTSSLKFETEKAEVFKFFLEKSKIIFDVFSKISQELPKEV